MADSELVSWVESERIRILEERRDRLSKKDKLKANYSYIFDVMDSYKDKMSEALAESGIPWVLRWDQDKITDPCTRMVIICASGPRGGARLIVGELCQLSESITFGCAQDTWPISVISAEGCLRKALGKVLVRIIT